MRRSPRLATIVLSVWSVIGSIAAGDDLIAHRVGSDLNLAVYVTAAPGDANQLFAVEQKTGNIRILDLNTGQLNPEPFLHVDGVETGANEQGLLGMAFHPDYENNGQFYVNYTGAAGATFVREYQVSPDDPSIADPATGRTIISFAQPFGNHNGGWIGFGPDGYLYIPTGDGGSGNDPGNRAQDITDQKLGKILRLDVNGDDFERDSNLNYAIPPTNPFVGVEGDDEIWAYGLRNPWRNSFDRLTGDFYIGDVGQRAREEINVQRASSTGGENYGWRLREGTIANPNGVGGPKPPGAIDPIIDFQRSDARSLTGGYVYRGPMQQIDGQYFFADFATGGIWSLEYDGSEPSTFDGTNTNNFIEWTGDDHNISADVSSLNGISSFGEDLAGNLYIVSLFSGSVFQLMPDRLAPRNGVVSLGGGGETYRQDFDSALTADASAVGVPLPDGWNAVTGGNEMNAIVSRPFGDSGDTLLGTYNAGAGADRTLALGVIDNETTNDLQLTIQVDDDNPVLAIRMMFDLEAWYGSSDLATLGEAAVTAKLEHDGRRGVRTLVDFNDGQPIKTSRTLASGPLDGNADTNRTAFDSGVVEVEIPAGDQFRVTIDANTNASSSGYIYGVDNFMFRTLAPGDADGNGVVDVADLLQLLGGQRFNKGVDGVTWEQGDFNADDQFDTGDLLAMLSFLSGTFPSDPYASEAGGANDAVADVIVNSETGEVTVDLAGHTVSAIIIESASEIFNGSQPEWDTSSQFPSTLPGELGNVLFTATASGVDELGAVISAEFLGRDKEFYLEDLDLNILIASEGGAITKGNVIVVPEPSTWLMLGLGSLALVGVIHRRR